MVQKKKPPTCCQRSRGGAKAPRAAARLSARCRARQGARPVPERRFRRDLAGRSQRRHRHEPSEPLWRVRRQARALHQELSALPRGRARGDDRDFSRGDAGPQTAAAHLCDRARHLSGRRKPARLLHGDDGGIRSGRRSRYPRHGAGRFRRARQGVRVLLPHGQGKGRDRRRPPIRSCWRNWHPRRCIPLRSARAPACPARNWKRSSRARSTSCWE